MASLKSSPPEAFAYLWEQPIDLPKTEYLVVLAKDLLSKKEGYAYISHEEKKNKFANVFDEQGNAIGQMRFNIR